MSCRTLSASDIAIALRESLAFEPRVSFWRKASNGRVVRFIDWSRVTARARKNRIEVRHDARK